MNGTRLIRKLSPLIRRVELLMNERNVFPSPSLNHGQQADGDKISKTERAEVPVSNEPSGH